MVTLNIPAERIGDESRQFQFWRAVLTVLAGLLFSVGWLAARTFAVLRLAVAWSAAAVKVGWQEGRHGAA
jgi:hypothetical protein